jgi:hypothetical protein
MCIFQQEKNVFRKKCKNTSEKATTVQNLLGAFESESEFCWLINHQLAEGAAPLILLVRQ